jgi:ABC-type Fe3+-hydroxamate transport system substrate-binding protein
MNKFFVLFIAIFSLVLSLAPLSAKRIISLTPSLTKNLQYLGSENELVGCTSYCKTSRKVPVVASAVKVNVEKVVSLKPDLVIASTLTQPETIAALKKMGVKTVVFPMAHSFNEICAQFLQLGKLIGKETQSQKVLRQINQKIAKLKATTKASNQRVFIQLGANPLFAVIPNTFMNDYIVFAGAKNITQGMTSGSITREAVLTRNPEAIFIVTMGVFAGQEKKEWERYPNLAAVKNKKIFIIDSDKACTPTPVTFAETLELILKSLK